jgi:hypothetical protein
MVFDTVPTGEFSTFPQELTETSARGTSFARSMRPKLTAHFSGASRTISSGGSGLRADYDPERIVAGACSSGVSLSSFMKRVVTYWNCCENFKDSRVDRRYCAGGLGVRVPTRNALRCRSFRSCNCKRW